MQAWIPAPYYTAPPQQRVECGPFYGSHPTAETMMQAWLSGMVSWPNGFVWNGQGSGDQTPRSLLDQAIDMAIGLTQQAPDVVKSTCVGFDPVASAVYYTNQLFDILKRIPATMANGMANPNDSIFDVWVAGKK